MITLAGITEGSCSAEEFATTDTNLPVCQEFDNDTWMTDFLAEIGPWNKVKHIDEEEQQEEEDEEDEGEDVSIRPVQLKLTTFSEAIQGLEAVAAILDFKGYTSEATQVSHITDVVAALKYSALNTRQATTDELFH